MENDKKSVFRQQSIDRISSPEELDGYLKVTGPGVWFTLLAIIFILIGIITWMIFGHLDTTLSVAVVSQKDETVCLIPKNDITATTNFKKIKIANKEYNLKDVGYSGQIVTHSMDKNILNAGSLKEGDSYYILQVQAKLSEGIYSGQIIVETISPISFITN